MCTNYVNRALDFNLESGTQIPTTIPIDERTLATYTTESWTDWEQYGSWSENHSKKKQCVLLATTATAANAIQSNPIQHEYYTGKRSSAYAPLLLNTQAPDIWQCQQQTMSTIPSYKTVLRTSLGTCYCCCCCYYYFSFLFKTIVRVRCYFFFSEMKVKT